MRLSFLNKKCEVSFLVSTYNKGGFKGCRLTLGGFKS